MPWSGEVLINDNPALKFTPLPKEIVLNGISPERITVKSYGEERPVEFGQDEKSYSKNRRVEIN